MQFRAHAVYILALNAQRGSFNAAAGASRAVRRVGTGTAERG
ncbi:MAG TPA: hypothetical protein VID47_09010 [Actinomycetota bacterium]|jgi:hypothetical protein